MNKVMIKFKRAFLQAYLYAEIYEYDEGVAYEHFEPSKPKYKIIQVHPFYSKTGKVCRSLYYYHGRDFGLGHIGYADKIREEWLKQNGGNKK